MNRFLLRIIALLLPATLSAQSLIHPEILGRATDTSITVQLMFGDSAEVRIRYGTLSGTYPFQTNWQVIADSTTAEIVLGGLQADTKYYYQVRYRTPGGINTVNRPEHSFHTQRVTGSGFTFVVQADPHLDASSDTALYRLCLQNQLADQPDFMIDLGDFLMNDKLAVNQVVSLDTIKYRCHLLRSYYETECHSAPLYIVMGNHEGEAGWERNGTPNNVAINSTNERKKYFPNPYPDGFYSGDTTHYQFTGQRQAYYAWEWGDAQFIVLDPYWNTMIKPDSLHGWRWTLGEEQYNWLHTTLQNSTSTFKYVFAHHLVGGDPQGRGGTEYADFYEWGGNNLDGTPGFAANRPGWYKPIKDLLTEYHVNIFFHGHDHFFAKQVKDCMVYQEIPQPSLPNFTYPVSAAAYGYVQGLILANSGHIRVHVDPTGTRVEYVRAFLPRDTNATRHNRDVSAMYFIGAVNCYDSLSTGMPMVWNSDYADEIIYPNPFSTETTISFTLSQEEPIHLAIYDNNGRFIRKLIDGNSVPAGKYTVVWDGKNGFGTEQPAGMYYCKLQGKNVSKTERMLIMGR